MTVSLELHAKTALKDSRLAHKRFEAMLVLLERRECNLGDLKPYFDLVQQKDLQWLHREAILRAHAISVLPSEPYDPALGIGVEINRQAALRYLREECGVKI